MYHLQELLESVTTHPVLKALPAAVELSKRYKHAESTLQAYENDMVAIWMGQHVRIPNYGLRCYPLFLFYLFYLGLGCRYVP